MVPSWSCGGDHRRLGEVHFLHATRYSGVSGFAVIGYHWSSPLTMHFDTAEGVQVHVDHGLAFLRWTSTNGTVESEEICSANATCRQLSTPSRDLLSPSPPRFLAPSRLVPSCCNPSENL